MKQPPPHSAVPGDLEDRRWTTLQHELRLRWNRLSDDDILRIAGRRDELLAVLHEKYHYTPERARKELETALGTKSGHSFFGKKKRRR